MKLVRIGKETEETIGSEDTSPFVDRYGEYLEFDNGMRLRSYHEQDCCEAVYAHFSGMQVMGLQQGNSVDSEDLDFFEDLLSSVVPIEGLGFYIVTVQGICILVPCYNIQNGYYDGNISLRYGKTEEKDLGESARWIYNSTDSMIKFTKFVESGGIYEPRRMGE